MLSILEEACSALPHTSKAMFGGRGFFAPNGGMFAGLVPPDHRIVLKFSDDADLEAFKALGGEPWVYQGRMTMARILLVPDDMLDEPRTLAEWAARAHAHVAPGKAKKVR